MDPIFLAISWSGVWETYCGVYLVCLLSLKNLKAVI